MRRGSTGLLPLRAVRSARRLAGSIQADVLAYAPLDEKLLTVFT